MHILPDRPNSPPYRVATNPRLSDQSAQLPYLVLDRTRIPILESKRKKHPTETSRSDILPIAIPAQKLGCGDPERSRRTCICFPFPFHKCRVPHTSQMRQIACKAAPGQPGSPRQLLETQRTPNPAPKKQPKTPILSRFFIFSSNPNPTFRPKHCAPVPPICANRPTPPIPPPCEPTNPSFSSAFTDTRKPLRAPFPPGSPAVH